MLCVRVIVYWKDSWLLPEMYNLNVEEEEGTPIPGEVELKLREAGVDLSRIETYSVECKYKI